MLDVRRNSIRLRVHNASLTCLPCRFSLSIYGTPSWLISRRELGLSSVSFTPHPCTSAVVPTPLYKGVKGSCHVHKRVQCTAFYACCSLLCSWIWLGPSLSEHRSHPSSRKSSSSLAKFECSLTRSFLPTHSTLHVCPSHLRYPIYATRRTRHMMSCAQTHLLPVTDVKWTDGRERHDDHTLERRSLFLLAISEVSTGLLPRAFVFRFARQY